MLRKSCGCIQKYRRCVNVVDGTDTAIAMVTCGLDIAGVSLLSTIIAVAIVVGMGDGAQTLVLIGKYASRKLSVKEKKPLKIAE